MSQASGNDAILHTALATDTHANDGGCPTSSIDHNISGGTNGTTTTTPKIKEVINTGPGSTRNLYAKLTRTYALSKASRDLAAFSAKEQDASQHLARPVTREHIRHLAKADARKQDLLMKLLVAEYFTIPSSSSSSSSSTNKPAPRAKGPATRKQAAAAADDNDDDDDKYHHHHHDRHYHDGGPNIDDDNNVVCSNDNNDFVPSQATLTADYRKFISTAIRDATTAFYNKYVHPADRDEFHAQRLAILAHCGKVASTNPRSGRWSIKSKPGFGSGSGSGSGSDDDNQIARAMRALALNEGKGRQ